MNVLAKIVLTFLVTVAIAHTAVAAPPEVTLPDYAFDFTTVGYEISVTGWSSYFSDPLDAKDYFELKDGGYTMRTVVGRLTRQNKKAFIDYYNKNCKKAFSGRDCRLMVTGEVALDDQMKMFLTADDIKVCNSDCSEILATYD